MTYTLHTQTAFRSDADKCPVCELTLVLEVAPYSAPVLFECFNHHLYFYLETVTGPTTGAGEIGYWTRREH